MAGFGIEEGILKFNSFNNADKKRAEDQGDGRDRFTINPLSNKYKF